MDYPCAKHGDFGLSCFGFIVRTDTYRQTDRQTDRQTESQVQMIAILTRLPSASVITGGILRIALRKKNVSKESLSRFFKPLSRLPMRPKLNVVT